MCIGEKRRLTIQSEWGYGSRGMVSSPGNDLDKSLALPCLTLQEMKANSHLSLCRDPSLPTVS